MKKCGHRRAASVSSNRQSTQEECTHRAGRPQVQFVVDGVPVKYRPRLGSNKNVYTPRKTREDEGRIVWAAKAAMGSRPPFTGPIELEVHAYLPVPRSWGKARRAAALTGCIRPTRTPDWDNIAKAISDALNHIAFVDDKQVVAAHVFKSYAESAHTVITITSLGETSDG